MKDIIHVTVWNEYRHEKTNKKIAKLYPDGMHGTIAKYLEAQPSMAVHTATLDEPEHGLTEEALNSTDVLIWGVDFRPLHRPPAQTPNWA